MKAILSLILILSLHNQICGQFEIEWVKTIGGNFDDLPSEIIRTSDNNLLLVGYTESTNGIFEDNHGNRDGFLIKMNSNGDIIWNKTFGGSNGDLFNSIIQLENLDLAIVGSTASVDGDITNTDSTGADYWFVQTNEFGVKEFDANFGGSAGESAIKILKTNNSEEILLYGRSGSWDGIASDHIGGTDFWGIKINENSDIIWNTTFGTSHHDYIFDAKPTLDGGSIVVGAVSLPDNWLVRDAYAAKLDLNGNIEWEIIFGGEFSDYIYSVLELENGDFLIGGETGVLNPDSTAFPELRKGWLLKLNGEGEIEWENKIEGNRGTSIRDIEFIDNQIYTIGSTQSDQGQILQTNGSWDIWMGIFTEEGEFIEYESYGGSGLDLASQILLLENEEILLIGSSQSNDFDVPGNQGAKDILLIKLASTTPVSKEVKKEDMLFLYPNPTEEIINMKISSEFLEGEMLLYNSIGQIVLERKINSESQNINLKFLENGVYFLEILNKKNGKKITKRILKENDH